MATEKNYIGHVLNVNETAYLRAIRKYNYFVDVVTPISSEVKRIGLSPLDSEKVTKLAWAQFDTFIDEFSNKATADLENVGFVFRPSGQAAIKKGVESLENFLQSSYHKIKEYTDQLDCPFVDGLPVVTDEFASEVKEMFMIRIRTQEGSDFYKAFLNAQSAMQAVTEFGASEGVHYSFEGGALRLLDICEPRDNKAWSGL